ncbi:hypothetical protein [Corynebacterium flavescens]|uniref:hypothetical protein n=1 Tax=Corynebacterium flavescens TaxID=28028 RepID=UPI003FCEFC73
MATPHNFAPDYSVAEAAAWTGEPAGNKRSSLPIIVGVVGAVVVLVAAIVVFALNWGSGLTSSPRAEQIAMTQSESGAQIARGTSAPASAATASSAGASTAAQEKETETVTVETLPQRQHQYRPRPLLPCKARLRRLRAECPGMTTRNTPHGRVIPLRDLRRTSIRLLCKAMSRPVRAMSQ